MHPKSPDKKGTTQGTPKRVTDASAPQATDDIVLFGTEAEGARLGEITDASAPTAVLFLDGGSGTAIRSLELDQWRGIRS